MKHALAVGLGLLGGLLLNLEIGALQITIAGPSDGTTDSSIVTLASVAWTLLLAAACTTLLLYRAQATLSVFKRGCALGLVLWTAMIPLAGSFTARLRDGAAAHASENWPFSAFDARNKQDAAVAMRSIFTTASRESNSRSLGL